MKKINWLLLIAILFLWAACSKDDVAGAATETTKELTLAQRTAGNNPYNVHNMQLAYQYLIEQGRLQPEMFPEFHIRPTHKYIKLKPTNIEEEDQILSDSTFITLDYPMDLDLPESYFDNRPELAEDEFSEYYSSIQYNQNIAYTGNKEILDEMYIPEEDPYFDDILDDYEESNVITNKTQLFNELIFTAYFFKGLDYLLNDDHAAKSTGIDDDKPQKPVLTNADNTLVLDGKDQNRFNDLIIKPYIWGIGKKWYPSGNIKYTDTSLPRNNITGQGDFVRNLADAQILIRQGFTLHNAITNAQGNFNMGKVNGKARYIIQWERRDVYNIKNEGGVQAETKGPTEKNRPWNLTIMPLHRTDTKYAIIHRAAMDYHNNPFNITKPRKNVKLKTVRATRDCTSSHVTMRRNFGGADILLCGLTEDCSETYGMAIHELAHSAHYQFNRPGYNKLVADGHIDPWFSLRGQSHDNPGPTARSARRTLETWATTVELRFVQRRYNLQGNGFDNNNVVSVAPQYRYLMQNYTVTDSPYYTSCGFDLTDPFNQNGWRSTCPIDNVSGYTIKQLESALYGATNWNAWRDNIKQQNTNFFATGNVDELFANWN